MSNDIAELKAISQNLMHPSIRTTDAIYGILSKNDVKEQIKRISKRINNLEVSTNDEIIYVLTELLSKLKK